MSTSYTSETIAQHLQDLVHEMRHGVNSHDDPNLPENWVRLERMIATGEAEIVDGEVIDLTVLDEEDESVAPGDAGSFDAGSFDAGMPDARLRTDLPAI